MLFARVICLLVVVLSMPSCTADYEIKIAIKKRLQSDLNCYRVAIIRIENDDYDTEIDRLTHTDAGILLCIEEVLEGLGIDTTGPLDKADLKLRCRFKESYGIPIRGRDMTVVHVKHIKWVNIELIDLRTNTVIGEVECSRPGLKVLPAKFIRTMFDELISSEKKQLPDSLKRSQERGQSNNFLSVAFVSSASL